MLQLFQSLFGIKHPHSHYPDELIHRAIERTVDAIDPRLRALPGYRKKLQTAVVHAIDHIVALVDGLTEPLPLTASGFASNPELAAYFTSNKQVQEILARDTTLNQWQASHVSSEQHVVMLLLMKLDEHRGFGMALDGDMLRRDVVQTTVSFSQHQLLDPTMADEDTRRLLKRRGFDHLLSLALRRIATTHTRRADLERERSLLRRKYMTLEKGHWGFNEPDTGLIGHMDQQQLEQQLKEIESQLLSLGIGTDLLYAHLDTVVDVLLHAEQNLWMEHSSLIMDRRHIKQTQCTDETSEINLSVLNNITGLSRIARLVSIAYHDLPPRRDFIHEAERYLG